MLLWRNRFCAALAPIAPVGEALSLPLRRSRLGSTSGGAVSPNELTEGVQCVEWHGLMVLYRPCRGRQLGDPSGVAALASPGGKLLSEAKLMRGGDRLVLECTRMNVIRFDFHHSTYCCRDFKLSPPLISHDKISVPRCRYFIVTASPRGKPRTQKILACTIQRSALLRERRVANLAPPTNSEVFGDFHSTNHSVAFTSGG